KPINGVNAKLPTSITTAIVEVIILWFKVHFKIPLYHVASFPTSLCWLSSFLPYNFFLNNVCDKAGTTVIATNNDAPSANVIVNANGTNNSPTIPPTKISGANTATITNVERSEERRVGKEW